MKPSLIAVVTAALADSAFALWCGCWQIDGLNYAGIFEEEHWQRPASSECCVQVTGNGLMGGSSFLGISLGGKDWCDAGNKSAELKQCCWDANNSFYGYCK